MDGNNSKGGKITGKVELKAKKAYFPIKDNMMKLSDSLSKLKEMEPVPGKALDPTNQKEAMPVWGGLT